MSNKLTSSFQLPSAIATRALNVQNGNDSEILSASSIINAFNAEVRWGSRNEDSSKIDMFISYDHPWINGERIILLIQIKGGPKYGVSNSAGVKLYKRSFIEVKRNLNNICLIWNDYNDGQSYWAYIHPNTNVKLTQFGVNHIVNPSIRFEIARNITRLHTFDKKGGVGIIMNFTFIQTPINTYRKVVKSKYNSYNFIINPLFGKVELTQLGWQHMFRKSRMKSYKSDSLYIIPYLKQILSQQPSKHWVNNFTKYSRKDFEFCQYEHVLSYENSKINTGINGKVVIKLLEEVGYPKEWKYEPLLSQRIIRRVVIKTCSWKKV